jgi:hypothetical protein
MKRKISLKKSSRRARRPLPDRLLEFKKVGDFGAQDKLIIFKEIVSVLISNFDQTRFITEDVIVTAHSYKKRLKLLGCIGKNNCAFISFIF